MAVKELLEAIDKRYDDYRTRLSLSEKEKAVYMNLQLEDLCNLYKEISSFIFKEQAEENNPEKKQNWLDTVPLSVVDIFTEELDNWGIPNTSFAYVVVMMLPKLFTCNVSYKEVISTIAKETGKSEGTISSSFSYIAKRADFSKTKYIPILKKRKHCITKEFVVKELLEFCTP